MSMACKVDKLTKHFTIEEYFVNQTGASLLTPEGILQAVCLEEFRTWLGKAMKVNAWYRAASYNKSVGGKSSSSHLKGAATDWSYPNVTKEEFIKYAKKWCSICKSHGVIGEAGLYKWGIHLGSSVKYSKRFYHWDTRSGKQVNMPFSELRKL